MAITTNGGAGVTADSITTLSNKTLEAPTINNATFTGAQAGLEIKFGNNIVLEGTTNNDFETTITAGDPTADRTITLPDVTGTVVTTGNLTAITTLTSPTITGAIFNDGSIVFEGTTANDFETTLAVTDPTADRTITFQDATGTVVLRDSTDTLTNKTLTSPVISSISNTGTLTLPTSTDTLVGRATTDTLTNKTLTSPSINDAISNYPTFKAPTETTNVVASAATGTINFDVTTSTVWYYTSNATANHTLNFRFDSSTTLDSKLSVGEAITCVWLNTNGVTPYYPSAITIDGSAITPKYQNGTSFSAGNASSVDAYSYTIVKTAATPTYVVLASQTKFA